MKSFSKGEVKSELIRIRESGFVPNRREGNHGGIGNTLEDLLGIEENNLPIPNAAEWELKCQKIGTTSLTTLFHVEPSPTAMRLVPTQLLPLYGWKHEKACISYPENEMSFRQTINSLGRSDRGFQVVVDEEQQKVMISFDSNSVSQKPCRVRRIKPSTVLGI